MRVGFLLRMLKFFYNFQEFVFSIPKEGNSKNSGETPT